MRKDWEIKAEKYGIVYDPLYGDQDSEGCHFGSEMKRWGDNWSLSTVDVQSLNVTCLTRLQPEVSGYTKSLLPTKNVGKNSNITTDLTIGI